MDANRQRFWMLADKEDWQGSLADAGVEYDRKCRRLRLRDRRPDRRAPKNTTPISEDGLQRLARGPAAAVDAFGTIAFWNFADRSVQASGALGEGAPAVTLWNAPINVEVVDLALGFDDVLYIALQEEDAVGNVVGSSIGMFDPRGRWQDPPVFEVSLEGFVAGRLAAMSGGGVWVLDAKNRRLGRVSGLPLRDGLPPDFSATTFRPVPENPNPPAFTLDERKGPQWLEGGGVEQPVAIACSPEGRLALLSWRGPNAATRESWLHIRDEELGWLKPKKLVGVGAATSVAWLSTNDVVVLPAPLEGLRGVIQPREALAYSPSDESAALEPAGGFLPLFNLSAGLFMKGVTLPPQYPVVGGKRATLHPMSAQTFATKGTILGRTLDGRRDDMVWHRIFVEAVFPPGCGAIVELAPSDDLEPPDDPSEWHPHIFGELPEENSSSVQSLHRRPARGVWWPEESEIPHRTGLLGVAPEQDRSGLFCALAQRPGTRVRRLEGRFLHTRVTLFGSGHRTPEIAALRVYGMRFAYRDEYLPELYHEDQFGDDADAAGAATPADFLDRFLGLFESVLTPLEDRVAAAQALMDAHSAPDDALEWLGSWTGVILEPTFPVERRRAWLAAAPRLFQTRGTFAGLQLALEIATGGRMTRECVRAENLDLSREVEYPTGGHVTGGELIVLENFRLRRLMATILGADLSLADDPLLPGLIVSANSYVGDTLFLGAEQKTELLALFRNAFSGDSVQANEEMNAVREFYEQLAYRATVFVHDHMESVDFGLIDRVAAQQSPAHVEVRVVRATYPLLVGLASLVDVDTYLGPRPSASVVQLNRTRIGEGDFILREPALDPRVSDFSHRTPPVARIDGKNEINRVESFTLSGAGSTAAPGEKIVRYAWAAKPPPL
jgi:phage tail-like protein